MKEIIKIQDNFTAVICDEFQDIIKKSCDFQPLNSNAKKIKRMINDGKIKAGVIDLGFWKSLIARWKKHSILVTVAFYNNREDYIYLNLPSLYIKASPNCTVYTTPNTSNYQFIANILAHELIHYVFQKQFIELYSFIRPKLIAFYQTLWSHIFYDTIINQVAEANFNVAIQFDGRIADEKLALVARNNLRRFLSILYKLKDTKHVKNRELFDETFQHALNILYGRYMDMSTDYVYMFRDAYVSIYDGYPESLYGQEIIFASEILALSTEIPTTNAKLITRRLLQYLD